MNGTTSERVQLDLEFEIVCASISALNNRDATLETSVFETLIKERVFTGAGFFTEFVASPFLKLDCLPQERRWTGVDYVLNDEEIRIGYVVSICGPHVAQIEGYTYVEPWPKHLQKFKILTAEEAYRRALRGQA